MDLQTGTTFVSASIGLVPRDPAKLEMERAAGVGAGGTIRGPGIMDSGIPLVITFLHGERASRRISFDVRVLRIFF